jgi:Tfp pilus assembly protein PilO
MKKWLNDWGNSFAAVVALLTIIGFACIGYANYVTIQRDIRDNQQTALQCRQDLDTHLRQTDSLNMALKIALVSTYEQIKALTKEVNDLQRMVEKILLTESK